MAYTIKYYFLLLLAASTVGKAQDYGLIAENHQRMGLAKLTVNSLYNWDFKATRQYIDALSEEIPGHPAIAFVKGMELYWQHFPINPKSPHYATHIAYLEEAIAHADSYIKQHEENKEALFFRMTARSVIMRHYADNNQPMKAAGVAKELYGIMTKGMEWQQEYPEYYFTSGLYNYYREYYPEAHPVYKPVAIFFKSGSKTTGLQQLKKAADVAVFTKAEALDYLGYIYLRCEKDQDMAIKFYKKLYQKFPDNLYFLANYTEALLLSGQYHQAEKLVAQLNVPHSTPYFKVAYCTFRGMLTEKHLNEIEKASTHYLKAEQLIKQEELNTPYEAYIYAGLAAYYRNQESDGRSKEYFKKAKKADNYNYVN
jgi:tetratricopeptide (TPR) repeat protein